MPPVTQPHASTSGKPPNKYPAQAAKRYLQALANAGLGTMSPKTAKRNSILVFKKRKFADMLEDALNIMKKLGIDESSYHTRKSPRKAKAVDSWKTISVAPEYRYKTKEMCRVSAGIVEPSFAQIA